MVGIQFLYHFQEAVGLNISVADQKVGQEDEAEEGGAYDGQGGEPTEVLQHFRVGEYEAEKGSDGRETSDGEGCDHLFDDLLAVSGMFAMCHDVDGVAENNSEDGRSGSDGNDGYLSFDEIEEG